MTKVKTKDPDGLPCECGSSDGRKMEASGWSHCFVCKKNFPPDKKEHNVTPIAAVSNRTTVPPAPLPNEYADLTDRGISHATVKLYGVRKTDEGILFPNYEGRNHVGTKLKRPDKTFKWTGTQADFMGAHLFPAGSAKYITVTEGEEDALAAYEMLGSKWPVVPLVNGTGTAKRDVQRNYEYLNSFQNIYLSFDNDDAGRKCANEIASMFAPMKVRIVSGKHKDACEYKKAGAGEQYRKDWWAAQPFMPDGLILGTTMWESIINRPQHFTTNYPWAGLNALTYGLRLSEMVVVTAETKIGKTSILKEIEYLLLNDEEIKKKGYGVGFLHLEEPNYDTALGLMSIYANKPLHLPDTPKSEEEMREAYDAVVNSERVVIWDHFGSNTVDAVLQKVRHMAALGCKFVVLDHLSIVVSDQSGDERKQLDEISTKLKTLCMELNIALIAVIHQNRQGQIRGTAGVEQLANIVIKLHRNKLDLDPWRRNVTKVVVQENRFCGRTGPACYLYYDETTGRLKELTKEEEQTYEDGAAPRDDQMPWE